MTLRKLLLGFNLSLMLISAFSIVLPFVLLGNDVFAYFSNNISGIGIMLLSFIAINIYFACNWSLFCLLEKGDWYSLLGLLRIKIFKKKHYGRKYIVYFIEVAIQLNNLDLLRELFEELQAQTSILSKFPYRQGESEGLDLRSGGKLHLRDLFMGWSRVAWQWTKQKEYRIALCARKRLCAHAIELGLPHLIDDPGHESEVYFGELREFKAFQQQRYVYKYKWAELFYAIALLVQGKYKFAAPLLEQLLLPQQMQQKQKHHSTAGTESTVPCWRTSFDRWRTALIFRLGGHSRQAISQSVCELQEQSEQTPHSEVLLLNGLRASLKGVVAPMMSRLKVQRHLREDALLRLVSIQLLEDLQENLDRQSQKAKKGTAANRTTPSGIGPEFKVDQQLINLRRAEIQRIYDSPKHWSSYLLKEQNQNIAITMIHQLIRSAYEQQLRPTHQAYLAGLEARNKAGKQSMGSQQSSYQR